MVSNICLFLCINSFFLRAYLISLLATVKKNQPADNKKQLRKNTSANKRKIKQARKQNRFDLYFPLKMRCLTLCQMMISNKCWWWAKRYMRCLHIQILNDCLTKTSLFLLSCWLAIYHVSAHIDLVFLFYFVHFFISFRFRVWYLQNGTCQ